MHPRCYAIQHRLDNVLRGSILEGRDRILARIRQALAANGFGSANQSAFAPRTRVTVILATGLRQS